MVWTTYRTYFGVEHIPDIFGVDHIPDIFGVEHMPDTWGGGGYGGGAGKRQLIP